LWVRHARLNISGSCPAQQSAGITTQSRKKNQLHQFGAIFDALRSRLAQ
jgi:hypothetical protein